MLHSETMYDTSVYETAAGILAVLNVRGIKHFVWNGRVIRQNWDKVAAIF